MGEAFPEIEARVFENSDEVGEGFIEVDLVREADKTIGLARLFSFREMIIEISNQSLPESKGWAGKMHVTQISPKGESTQELFW